MSFSLLTQLNDRFWGGARHDSLVSGIINEAKTWSWLITKARTVTMVESESIAVTWLTGFNRGRRPYRHICIPLCIKRSRSFSVWSLILLALTKSPKTAATHNSVYYFVYICDVVWDEDKDLHSQSHIQLDYLNGPLCNGPTPHGLQWGTSSVLQWYGLQSWEQTSCPLTVWWNSRVDRQGETSTSQARRNGQVLGQNRIELRLKPRTGSSRHWNFPGINISISSSLSRHFICRILVLDKICTMESMYLYFQQFQPMCLYVGHVAEVWLLLLS